MSDRFVSRHAFAIALALCGFGCAQEVGAPSNGVEQTKDDLYLVGHTWPSGTVFVCFDPIDGANATLIAEAQRVLADSWSRAAAITFPGGSPLLATAGWGPCDYSFRANGGNYSTVALHFCGGSGSSSNQTVSLFHCASQPFVTSWRIWRRNLPLRVV